jgi:hypothetical protein
LNRVQWLWAVSAELGDRHIMSEQPEKPDKPIVRSAAVDRVLSAVFGEEAATQGQSKKRLVSKSKYAMLLGTQQAKFWGSVALAVAIAGCYVFTLGSAVGMFFVPGIAWKGLCVVVGTLSVMAARCIKRVAEKAMRDSQTPLDVVPLTRANIAVLPPPDTLVRASEAPSQTHLLRAAGERNETPPEELLRPIETGLPDSPPVSLNQQP